MASERSSSVPRAVLAAAVLVLACAGVSTSVAASGEQVLDTITARWLAPEPRFAVPGRWTAPGRPTVALALSGGGARGLATVGLLQEMFDDGVEIDAIAGTSIGSLVGALVCSGYDPRAIELLLREKDLDSMLSGLDVRRRVLSRSEELYRNAQVSFAFRRGRRLQVGALAESDAFKRELYRYLLRAQLESGGNFDRLLYPFRAVATDVLTGKAIVPSSGDLVAAVRGSSALPGLFRPVEFGDALLVDGLLVENIPVETAGAFGTDLVLAVDVSEGLAASREVHGAAGLLNRSLNIVAGRRNEELRSKADLVLSPQVAQFPQVTFGAHLDELIHEGREEYGRRRQALWSLLQSRASDRTPLRYDKLEVLGTGWITPAELSGRLGGAPGDTTRFRVASELTRALNLGPFAGGHVLWIESSGERTLRFLFEEHPPLQAIELQTDLSAQPTRLEPGAKPRSGFGPGVRLEDGFSPAASRNILWHGQQRLLERGGVLVELDSFDWDPGSGTVRARLTGEPFRRIDTRVRGDIRLERTERFFKDLQGRDFAFDRLANRLDELVARGAIFDWTLTPVRAPDGDVDLEIHVRGDDYFAASASGAFRGPLGFAGFLRGAKSNFTGRGDFVELLVAGAKDVSAAQVRYRTEYGIAFQNLGAEVGFRYFDNAFLIVDGEQELVEELEENYSGERVWLSLIRRLRWGAVVQAELFHERNRFDATAGGEPGLSSDRTSAVLKLELDRHDRLLFPERGGALLIHGETSVGGDALWKAETMGDVTLALGRARRHVLTARLGAGISEDADRRPFWFNPGGFRSLYGFIPYGAAAPQYARAGLTWRYRALDFKIARIYAEAGADWITTAIERSQLGDQSGILGYGVSLTANVKFIGPITLGLARNDTGADIVFVTVGIPFLGE